MGLTLNPTMIILFVIGAIIAITALSTMLTGDSVADYYDANDALDDNANVSQLFILIATFVPIGIILSVLVYFFKMGGK